jgi:HAD superfamily hydrolase (TIGR01458 family)
MNMNTYIDKPIQAILLDLDGVLYVGNQPVPAAGETVQQLLDSGLKIAGITNTTTQSLRAIAEKLAAMGIPIRQNDIYTPAAIACQVIGNQSAALFIRDALLEDFSAIRQDDEHPDFVLMGDIGGEGYPPEILRRIFELVMNGAQVLALHKNRFWQREDGLHLDLGVFVAAVEYASGKQAQILGKPSADFFLGICDALKVSVAQAVMVGDDVESDIGGAQQAGLTTVLVQTGKYREAFVRQTGIRADHVIPTINDLPMLLKSSVNSVAE